MRAYWGLVRKGRSVFTKGVKNAPKVVNRKKIDFCAQNAKNHNQSINITQFLRL